MNHAPAARPRRAPRPATVLALLPLLALLLDGVPFPASAQTTGSAEVGVVENLGGKVPLDIPFLDEEGRPVTLRALLDRPVILTLNYFRCAGICTPILNGIVDILNGIGLDPEKDFRIITVSFDTRDTPELAKKKRENLLKQLRRPFPPAAWRLLTGGPAEIEALTGAVGFRFKPAGGEFMHAGVIIALSPDGTISRYLYGTSWPVADAQMALVDAGRGEVRPTIAKLLEFCYVYDPESRTVVFALTRVVGAVTFLCLALFAFLLLRRPSAAPPTEDPAPPEGGAR